MALSNTDRQDLKWAMKRAIAENSAVVQENASMKEYVEKEITYEQLLNLVFNPIKDEVYLESTDLEEVAVEVIKECLAPVAEDKYSLLEQDGAAPTAPAAPKTSIFAKMKSGVTKAASKVKAGSKIAGSHVWKNKGKYAIGGTVAASLYYLYKKLRRKGKSEAEAANQVAMAAARAGDTAGAARWKAKAKKKK